MRTIEQSLAFLNMLLATQYKENADKQRVAYFLVALKFFYPKYYKLLHEKKSFDFLIEISSDMDFKNLLKEETTLYALLIGSTVSKENFTSMCTIYHNAFLQKGEKSNTSLSSYKNIPFDEKSLSDLLSKLDMHTDRVLACLNQENVNVYSLYSTFLFDTIADIEFTKKYSALK